MGLKCNTEPKYTLIVQVSDAVKKNINKNKTMVSLTAKKVGNIREHKEIDGPLPMKIQALICVHMLKTKRR